MQATPDISALRSRADRAVGRRDGVQSRLKQVNADIKRLENEEELLDLVAGLFRTLIDQEVTVGVQAVERLLTEGLQAVFDDQDLKVEAKVEVQRGKVSVDLVTKQVQPDGTVIEGVSSDAFGGAVTTVESILLRIIVVMRRGLRLLLLLDEALPAFDSNYAANMGRFLNTLAEKLGLDLLLVTHNPALVDAAGRAYRIVKKDGEAKFRRLR